MKRRMLLRQVRSKGGVEEETRRTFASSLQKLNVRPRVVRYRKSLEISPFFEEWNLTSLRFDKVKDTGGGDEAEK